jgi:hypothetical protein
VCIKLTREQVDHHGKPIGKYDTTLIIDHRWHWADGKLYIKKGSSATAETDGRMDISLGVLIAGWTAESSTCDGEFWHKYDKEGHFQGDTLFPSSQAALEAQVSTAPVVQQPVAPLAGSAPQTHSVPPGASSGAAKPADGATGMNDLTSIGPTDAYLISLGQQEWKEA